MWMGKQHMIDPDQVLLGGDKQTVVMIMIFITKIECRETGNQNEAKGGIKDEKVIPFSDGNPFNMRSGASATGSSRNVACWM